MLQFVLVGYNHFGFTSDNGKYVEGYKFHVNRPSSVQGMVGQEACSITVSEQLVQKCGEPKVNTVYNVVYDQKGRIASYAPVQK